MDSTIRQSKDKHFNYSAVRRMQANTQSKYYASIFDIASNRNYRKEIDFASFNYLAELGPAAFRKEMRSIVLNW